ncbi:MAG: LytR/AlgR family response regulator transcription factor [Marinicella sp.]
MSIKAVIVEDSRLAQNELLELLKPHDSIQVVAKAKTVAQAITAIEQEKPDLILLDINLPDGTGFDVLDQIQWCPAVIFTTAYDEFAIKAFEMNALDYLMKPVSEKRFSQALKKVLSLTDSQATNKPIDHKIFVKDKDRCWLVDINTIRYFVSHGNYTQINFGRDQPLVYKSLSQIQTRLPEKQFFRANRSHIVNIEFIKNIEPCGTSGLLLTMDDEAEIDVSRRHASHFKQMLSL